MAKLIKKQITPIFIKAQYINMIRQQISKNSTLFLLITSNQLAILICYLASIMRMAGMLKRCRRYFFGINQQSIHIKNNRLRKHEFSNHIIDRIAKDPHVRLVFLLLQ